MSVQLARYLKDFSAPSQAAPSFFPSSGFAGPSAPALPAQPAAPPVDVEAERAEAFAEGRAAAEAELTARHDVELQALRQAHVEEIEALRSRYEEDYAKALAARFSGLTEAVADLVAAQAAQVLAPVLTEMLTKGAVADLARMIAAGLGAGEGLTVTVKGPASLFQQLKSHFGENAPAFRHVEMQDVDLTVEFGEAVLVTRMAAWADTVRKVLG